MSERGLTSRIVGTFCLSLAGLVLAASSASAEHIDFEYATEVAVTSASVEAIFNPAGVETTYRFEYGPTSSYGTSVPIPAGAVGANSTEETVREVLTDLQPQSTYHFRVVLTSAEGTTYGPDRSFMTFALPAAPNTDTCPNAMFRTGFSSSLPDCRAYEMVSPADKNGADVNAGEQNEFVAAANGQAVEFPTRTSLPGAHGSGDGGFSQYVAKRGGQGWQTYPITPTPAVNSPLMVLIGQTRLIELSENLERAVFLAYALPGVPAVPERENLYLEDTSFGNPFEALTRFEGVPATPVSSYAVDSVVGDSSDDLAVATFVSRANLAPPATGSVPKLYALDHGVVRLVGIMPDGSVPAKGSTLAHVQSGPHSPTLIYKDTVSRDGSRIVFMSPASGAKQLYMRKDEATTVQISKSEASEPLVAANVRFQRANPEDTKVLFTTTTPLTNSDPGGAGLALYMYSDGQEPEIEANLTFIARFASNGKEIVKGLSDDGTHVYFEDENALVLWANGKIQKVAPAPDAVNGRLDIQQAIVSRDGKRIAFTNLGALTANEVASLAIVQNAEQNAVLYVYDEASHTLRCASCPPTGAAVTIGAEITVAATGENNPGIQVDMQPRFFSSDGKYVFFNTVEPLVPQDTNGLTDAYEYNVDTGQVSLMSPGTGDAGTWFVEAGESGSDVFLATRLPLSEWDVDKLDDVYDARVEGGLPEPPPPPVPCAGDECQGIPSAAPSFTTSSGFSGPGNAALRHGSKAPRKAKPASGLRAALKRCHRRRGRERVVCERAVRKRFSARKSVTFWSVRTGH